MAWSYFPFDAGAGSDVREAQWTKMARQWLRSGPIPDQLGEFAVVGDASGLQVKVRPGQAWLEGHFAESDEVEVRAITPNSSGNPRIDRVVLRLDWTANAPSLVVLPGTPAVNPSPPALTRTASVWDIPLARVAVAHGATTITAADVTDERVMATAPIAIGAVITGQLGDGAVSTAKLASGAVTSTKIATGVTLTQVVLDSPRVGTGLYDANGNLLLAPTVAVGAANYLRLANAATGAQPQLVTDGSDTNVGLAILAKGSGAINLAANGGVYVGTLALPANAIVTAGAAQTLTSKTLTEPALDRPRLYGGGLRDLNGNVLLDCVTIGAGNYVQTISVNSGGGVPGVAAAGADANINLNLISKGTGNVLVNGQVAVHAGNFASYLGPANVVTTTGSQTLTSKTLTEPALDRPRLYGGGLRDLNGNVLLDCVTIGAGNYVQTISVNSGGGVPGVAAAGADANINLNLISKGTGQILANGSPVVHAGNFNSYLGPANAIPSGLIAPFAGASPPTGWLLCDGAAYSKDTYPNLFAVIGTTYGGNGAPNFNVPNLKGRAPFGADGAQGEFNVIGKTGGAKSTTLTATQLPAHTHSFGATSGAGSAHAHAAGSYGVNSGGAHTHGVGTLAGTAASAGAHTHGYFTSVSTVNVFAPGSSPSASFGSATTESAGAHTHTVSLAGDTASAGDHNHAFVGSSAAEEAHTHTVSGTTGSTGGADAVSVLPPYMALHYIIKT